MAEREEISRQLARGHYGLLRQYLPHATDLSRYSQGRLDAIAVRLNTRPRMTLAYQTPAAKLAEIVASMG